jgi:hypothetical protein
MFWLGFELTTPNAQAHAVSTTPLANSMKAFAKTLLDIKYMNVSSINR